MTGLTVLAEYLLRAPERADMEKGLCRTTWHFLGAQVVDTVQARRNRAELLRTLIATMFSYFTHPAIAPLQGSLQLLLDPLLGYGPLYTVLCARTCCLSQRINTDLRPSLKVF